MYLSAGTPTADELISQNPQAFQGISGRIGAIQSQIFGTDLGQENIFAVTADILNGKNSVAGYENQIHGLMSRVGALQARYNNHTVSVKTVVREILTGFVTPEGYEAHLVSLLPPKPVIIPRPQRPQNYIIEKPPEILNVPSAPAKPKIGWIIAGVGTALALLLG